MAVSNCKKNRIWFFQKTIFGLKTKFKFTRRNTSNP